MQKELEPIIPPAESFWGYILSTVAENPASSQPVIMRDPATGKNIGTFNASSVKEDCRTYLLIENVSTNLNKVFATRGHEIDMQTFSDGVYLIPATSPIFMSL